MPPGDHALQKEGIWVCFIEIFCDYEGIRYDFGCVAPWIVDPVSRA